MSWTGRTRIIAHRGVHARDPENSLAALQAAIVLGADGVEVDIRRTGDGTLVLCHDAEVMGRPLHRASYGELQRFAPWIPRLADAAATVGGQTFVNFELKERGYESEVVAVVRRYFAPGCYMLSAFSSRCVAKLRVLDHAGAVGLLVGGRSVQRPATWVGSPFAVARARAVEASAVVVHWRLIDRPLIERARRAGLQLYAWTVNDVNVLERLVADPDVAGVISDVPDVAMRIAAQTRARFGRLESGRCSSRRGDGSDAATSASDDQAS